MSFAGTLCLVLVAVYGLTSLLLSILVAGLWRAGLARTRSTSGELLALRLLPSAGAVFLTFTIVLPAFLIYEPHHEVEQVGPLLVMLAVFALVTVGGGILRGWRAWVAATALLRNCGPADRSRIIAGQTVDIFDVPEPLVAVVGAWRPRLVAARTVLAACSDGEFRQVIAHEAAHVSAHDNLKLLLLLVSPDALAWMPTGEALTARWRAVAELEADALSTGADRYKRVALASALLKVARLSTGTPRQFAVLSMPIALDDVEGRVRQLLAPSLATPSHVSIPVVVAACALLLPVIAVPLYGPVQQWVEALVGFAR
jgi:hypothetical protein